MTFNVSPPPLAELPSISVRRNPEARQWTAPKDKLPYFGKANVRKNNAWENDRIP